MSKISPIIPLPQYQQRWVTDKSRFKIGCFTRQGGKSFGSSLEVTLDCQEHRSKWVFLSAGERQSKELMGTARMHTKAQGLVVSEFEDRFRGSDQTQYKQLETIFPNESRIVGLPANPDTARGHSANILLDEFAFHKDGHAIWKALFPTVTRGYKIRIVSTHKGKKTKFFDIMHVAPTLQLFNGTEHTHIGERGGWSKHFVDIYMAVQMGLELRDDEGRIIEPEDLRLALSDDDAWTEEFECIASDEATAFITHDLISSVEDIQLDARPEWVAHLVAAAEEAFRQNPEVPVLPTHVLANVEIPGDLYLGFDVGRKKDLSVIWADVKVGSYLKTLAVIELAKMPYTVQETVLYTLMGHPRFRRGCIDESGLGSQLAERAVIKYGEHRVEGVPFSASTKETLAYGLKRNFEDRGSQIPVDNTIRASLHSVKKYETATKHFRFDAERTDETGHADHFWAKALCINAASSTGPAICLGSDPEEIRPTAERDRGRQLMATLRGIAGRYSVRKRLIR